MEYEIYKLFDNLVKHENIKDNILYFIYDVMIGDDHSIYVKYLARARKKKK